MKLKIAIAADHAGFDVKNALVETLTKLGHEVVDFGTHSEDSVDYPDYAQRVALAVSKRRVDRGILACGTGLGMAMAANKIRGIRAGSVWSPAVAKLASEHNWMNVLCIPSRMVPLNQIKKIVQVWLRTPFDKGGRHERRVKKILKLESKS